MVPEPGNPQTLNRYGSRLPRRTAGVAGWRAFDLPGDQPGIRIGIRLWHAYGLSLTPKDIVEAIKGTEGLTTE